MYIDKHSAMVFWNMARTKTKRFWLIQGFDGTKMFYEKKIEAVQIAQEQMKALLKALAAKHLTHDEIVGAHAAKGASRILDFIFPSRQSSSPAAPRRKTHPT